MATTRKADGRFELDQVGESILYEGANLSQLSVLFKADHRILKERMYGIGPVGKRRGVDIYDIAEVASRMGKLSEAQITAAMKRMNHDQLPKQLTKEYWAGLRSRQEYEFRAGDLWPTTKVVAEVGEMVKALKMELDLLTDAIERNTEMTDRQREVAKQLVNGAKTNMIERLHDKFKVKPPTDADEKLHIIADDDDEL